MQHQRTTDLREGKNNLLGFLSRLPERFIRQLQYPRPLYEAIKRTQSMQPVMSLSTPITHATPAMSDCGPFPMDESVIRSRDPSMLHMRAEAHHEKHKYYFERRSINLSGQGYSYRRSHALEGMEKKHNEDSGDDFFSISHSLSRTPSRADAPLNSARYSQLINLGVELKTNTSRNLPTLVGTVKDNKGKDKEFRVLVDSGTTRKHGGREFRT